MSAKLVTTILQKRINDGKILVIALASHCFGESLSCWPSISRLALLCQTTERQIFRLLSRLKRDGYVTSERHGQKRAVFTLHPDKIPDLQDDAHVTLEIPQHDAQVSPKVTPRSLQHDAQVSRNNERKVLNCKSNSSAKQVRGDDFQLTEQTTTPKNGSAVDSRHSGARDLIKKLHREKFGRDCQWGPSEGKQLAEVLKEAPTWTAADLERLIRARFASDGVAPDRPRKWLPNLCSYDAGRLNKFHQPVAQSTKPRQSAPDAADVLRELKAAR